jgi:hypothetical protein
MAYGGTSVSALIRSIARLEDICAGIEVAPRLNLL